MAEENQEIEVTKNSANGEMSPQEDGTKVPLTAESPAAVEVKFTPQAAPNGDAEIDVGDVPTFSGLTKDELMQYSKDPFWVKLRWFLFILFWFAWLVMLVAAIVIIVLTPSCPPPPVLQWVQESPMLVYSNIDEDPNEFVEKMNSMKVCTAFVPDVINSKDFEAYNTQHQTKMEEISKVLSEGSKKIVTNFVDDNVPSDHVWFGSASVNTTGLLDDQQNLDYSSPGLLSTFKDILSNWVDKGFHGFLMADADTKDKMKFRDELNMALEEKEGAFTSGIVDMKSELPLFAESNTFYEFLQNHIAQSENTTSWKYFLYNPFDAVGQSLNHNHVPLITVGLFLVPGTPIVKMYQTVDSNVTAEVIKDIAQFRKDSAIQFGNTMFVNTTLTENVVAYTRIQKGTKGYAVAINLDTMPHDVKFSSIKNIPEKGHLKYLVSNNTQSFVDRKEDIQEVKLQGLEAKIFEFVPVY